MKLAPVLATGLGLAVSAAAQGRGRGAVPPFYQICGRSAGGRHMGSPGFTPKAW